ncbi:DUF881 domain-containing protein [Oerskovia flava]|uniref:DUF881 domain-containing protein n=1 Tax=Oerskovia flava TaxID=2986422 RepID=UPI00223EE2F3|nr:DUF881 domain-containing protein [Oerskovia sp. JB1-3-2]
MSVSVTGPQAGEPQGPAAPSRARRVRASLTVGLVLALAGLMFVSSAQLAQGRETRHPQNLAQLVDREGDRVGALVAEVDTLAAEVNGLSQGLDQSATKLPEDLVTRTQLVSGDLAVTGPGVTVALDDAPVSALDVPGVRPDDLVVHQQDLQAVINALWAGGAEAMTLQGQRVTATSAFRCAGNILILHGRVYSPPYVVQAVGDPESMEAALDRSPEIAIYKEYVDAVNLGWSAQRSSSLEIPRFEGSTELQFAELPDGTEVFS